MRTDKKGKPDRSLKYNNRILKQLTLNPTEYYQLDKETILTGQELAVLSADLEPDRYTEKASFTKLENIKQMNIFHQLAKESDEAEDLKLSAEQLEALKPYISSEHLKDLELKDKVSELEASAETLKAENTKKAERITELEQKLSESEEAKSNAISQKESLATKLELTEELAEHGKTWLAQERKKVLKAYTTAMELTRAKPNNDRIEKIEKGSPEFLAQCRELYEEALESNRQSVMSYNKVDNPTTPVKPIKETRAQKRKRTARSVRSN